MRHLSCSQSPTVTVRRAIVLGIACIALLGTAFPATAINSLDFLVVQGFDVGAAGAAPTAPVPHVMCHNETGTSRGEASWARAHMDLGTVALAYAPYTKWTCHSSSTYYSSQLPLAPQVGDVIVQKIRGVSDNADPTFEIDNQNYDILGISCRALSQGGVVVTSTTEDAVAGNTETWSCDFTPEPAQGTGIIVTIIGTWF
ncbi:MAG: hypothetical protein AAGE94_24750 [Acidobacteriota bacterium]